MKKAKTKKPVYPRLYLYKVKNYGGRRFVWRGNVGIRNLNSTYSGGINSLRFYSPSADATLVLFDQANFTGNFRLFRGTTDLPDLDAAVCNSKPVSLIISQSPLTIAQIQQISRSGTLPPGYRTV